MTRTTWLEKVLVTICGLTVLWGFYALFIQIKRGHSVTGMRDNVVWGVYIVNFIFFIGISYAGALISGILYLLKVEWRKPIIRIAEIITVISTILGPLFLATVPDFAILRDSGNPLFGKWRRRFYRFFAIGYQDNEKQRYFLRQGITITSIIIIPLAVLVHSVLSWIFGMTLRPGWHSTIFAPYFVVAAVYSGTGVLIIAMWAFRKFYHLEEYLQEKHFQYLGIVLLVLGGLYGYFTFSEYLTSWYGSEKWELHLIYKLFSREEFGLMFFYAAFIGVLLPLIIVAIPKTRTINGITIASVIVITAMWVKRYIIIIPTLETPLLPMQESRMAYVHYSITWVEWALTFSGIAAFFLFFYFSSKFVPIIPVSELAESNDKDKNLAT
jgi:molybdopterin-containing oxidoreductase family membrane subunit